MSGRRKKDVFLQRSKRGGDGIEVSGRWGRAVVEIRKE